MGAMSWQPILTAPQDGTVILARGTAHGDYGYTSDCETTYLIRWESHRWRVTQPMPRYFNGFTPMWWYDVPIHHDI